MKGIVFTEFMDMVSHVFSEDMVDDVIDDAKLPHGGAYTAVGTYPFSEMASLVTALSVRSGIPAGDLIHQFGQFLFGRFSQLYPQFLVGHTTTFSLLAGIEDVIHAEVKKLYPDAELPAFDVLEQTEQRQLLQYRSPRCLDRLAQGLVEGSLLHYRQTGRVILHPQQDKSTLIEITLTSDS
ncbi:MAG: heme NO-binding domain-containing protein [Plesiomonas sp.]